MEKAKVALGCLPDSNSNAVNIRSHFTSASQSCSLGRSRFKSVMAAPLTEAQKLAALEPDFRFLLSEEEGIPTATIAAIHDLGYTSCKLWSKFDADEAAVKAGIATDLGIKATDSPQARMLVAKLLTAWEVCKQRVTTKQKVDAEAAIHNEIRPWRKPDFKVLVDNFKLQEGYALTSRETPACSLLERRSEELESGELVVERLSEVVTKDHITDESSAITFSRDGVLRMKKGVTEIAMPRNPEELRSRLETWGLQWILLKYKYPQQARLQTATLRLHETYTKFLLGEDVYGLCSLNDRNEVVGRPSWGIILAYEFRLRKHMIDKMNEGMDIAAALKDAMDSTSLKERYLTTPTAVSSLSLSSGRTTMLQVPGESSDRDLPWMRGMKEDGKGGGNHGGNDEKDTSWRDWSSSWWNSKYGTSSWQEGGWTWKRQDTEPSDQRDSDNSQCSRGDAQERMCLDHAKVESKFQADFDEYIGKMSKEERQ